MLELLAQRPGLSNSELARGAFVSRQSMNVLLQFLERADVVTGPVEASVGPTLPTKLTPLGSTAAVKAVEGRMGAGPAASSQGEPRHLDQPGRIDRMGPAVFRGALMREYWNQTKESGLGSSVE